MSTIRFRRVTASRGGLGAPAPSARPEPDEALDLSLLAGLDDATLSRMDRDELTRVIVASGHPWRADLPARLPYADRGTLLRLAFLGRQCSRRRLQGGRETIG